jgi:hypothetical protein
MAGMDERGKAFENKWAHDAETRFRVEAKRNRAVGLWAAGEKGLTGEAAEDFAASVIAADFEEVGDEDVFRKLRGELDAGRYPDTVIRAKMKEALDAAIVAVTKS